MKEGFLRGRAALVTGASRNLGRAFTVMLARHGADVMVHYHGAKSRADAEETCKLARDRLRRRADLGRPDRHRSSAKDV